MRQLNGFLAMRVGGGIRITSTFDLIDDNTGELLSSNNTDTFVAVDPSLIKDISDVENYLIEHRLNNK